MLTLLIFIYIITSSLSFIAVSLSNFILAADGGCEMDVVNRMNEGYRAWGALKSVLSNRGLGIKAKKCLYEGVIAPTALYGAEA